jgi:uncharacterized membrane protein YphA (DoxX/SURF4 family)
MSSEQNERVPMEERLNGGIVGGVRILVGLMWLANMHWKVPPDFGEPTNSGLYKFSESVTRNSPFAPFTWVTEELILPNFRLFGWATLLIELVVAMLLIIGYRTKVASLLGAAISVPILLSVLYYDRADEWSWAYFIIIGIHLLLFAVDAGKHLGVDGVLRRSPAAADRSLTIVGIVAVVTGLLGLFVARSVGFAGSEVALLGSDAGFVNADGNLVRRWELKFLWFNPLWALLTIGAGALLVAGTRLRVLAFAGSAAFALMAVVVFVMQRFDYLRDDGSVSIIGTSSNTVVWAGLAVAGALLARRAASGTVSPPKAA